MAAVVPRAWQSWSGAKSIALLAIIAFAIGVGSTTAIYTVVNGVMLAPLPYPHGERYTVLYSARFSEPDQVGASSADDLLEYDRRVTSFDVFGWFRQHQFNLTAPGEPQHVTVTAVTLSLAHHLGVDPLIGRWFDNDAGAVISHRLWQRLGGDASLVGQGLTLNGRRYTVTGVMPRPFVFPLPGPGTIGDTDVWIARAESGGEDSDEGWFIGYGRRKPEVSFAQADADVKAVAAEIARLAPASHPSYTARLIDLRETTIEAVRPTLLLLFAAAALLLAITCANVAGLLLTRSIARARETATRVALGASQRQLAFQYFLEGLLPALAGGAAGIAVSLALVRVMLTLGADYIPRADAIGTDWRVVLFGTIAAIAASTAASLAPLWQAMRMPPNEVLSAGVRASAGRRAQRLSRALVVAEIALAFTLLAVAAVLIGHLRALSRVSPGFDPQQLITFQLTLPEAALASDASRIDMQRRLIDALRAIPGVTHAAFANQLPLDGCCLGTVLYPDGQPVDADRVERIAHVTASTGFVETLRIPLEAGRLLTDADTDEALANVVINHAAAAHYWPGRNPLDARGRLGDPQKGLPVRVVGVVGDIRNNGLDKPTVPEVYLPGAITTVNPMAFVVRSALPADRTFAEIRGAVRSVDATLPVDELTTMSETMRASLTLERAGSFVVGFFALAALLLAMLGVYGVVSYAVRQRRVEIGTRLALGASARDVVSLVVAGGWRMAAAGVAVGGLVVVAAASLIVRFFNVADLGWLPFVASAGIVAVVAGAASSIPAWRATWLSPMAAIRDETQSAWDTARHTARDALVQLTGTGTSVDEGVTSERTLLTEFVAAARRADSSAEALRASLATLARELRAEWVRLLEVKRTEGPAFAEATAGTREGSPGSTFEVTAATREGDAVSIPAEGYLLNRLRGYSYPLTLDPSDLESVLAWAREHRTARVQELETLLQSGARLAVGLRTKSEMLGVLLLGPPAGRAAYGAGEKRVLSSAADHFALMIENARLTTRVVEQEKLRRDVALAAEVQKRLLPERPPDAAIATLAAMSVPARSVGGDYYDFIDAGDNRLGIALADVAGKGVAAALIMAAVQATLRILASENGISLPQLAARMNHFLHQTTPSASYATFFYAQLDQQTRKLRYVNAGHNPPYLVRTIDGFGTPPLKEDLTEIHELKTGGTVIGLLPETSYEEASVELQSGDVLVAFTDGVTEALNAAGDEFGEARLKDVIRQATHLPVQQISARISDDLRLWIGDTAQYDDLTFIVMKVN